MSNMVIYMTRIMHYDPAFASVQLMLFEGTCYLTPILGAWLADSRWGRFYCILVFSIIYFAVRPALSFSRRGSSHTLLLSCNVGPGICPLVLLEQHKVLGQLSLSSRDSSDLTHTTVELICACLYPLTTSSHAMFQGQ